jgi:hypothetical protein
MAHWLENGQLHHQQQAQNARRLGKPRAAYDIVELIWALDSSRE